MPPRFQDTAVFEKGEEVVLKIPFVGNPKPTMKWFKDNVAIQSNSKFKVELGERHALLTISNASRSDSGSFRLQLDNELGSDSAIIKIAINGEFYIFENGLNLIEMSSLYILTLSLFTIWPGHMLNRIYNCKKPGNRPINHLTRISPLFSAHITFFNRTFHFYNCRNCYQQHTKIWSEYGLS